TGNSFKKTRKSKSSSEETESDDSSSSSSEQELESLRHKALKTIHTTAIDQVRYEDLRKDIRIQSNPEIQTEWSTFANKLVVTHNFSKSVIGNQNLLKNKKQLK
ncbi:uncharacterized protein LOC134853519, partial [Symsagittifera roscoffensis]|uniref:uncharacterized protein LOC134853519 n=1 Tax=Symsagittifera roscoffensis TaxID=84072 RepID=UPI00307BED23